MAIKELKYEDVKQFNVKDRNKWHEFAKTSASEDENHIVKYAAELAYQLEIVREKNGGLNNLFQMLDATERALKQFGEFGISPNDHDKAMCILIQTCLLYTSPSPRDS